MKKILKQIVVSILAWQVKRLQNKNNFKIIAVAGSYGKTTTKLAIAHTLKSLGKVRYQRGNYNDNTTVPLVFFNQTLPTLFNPLAWVLAFIKNEQVLSKTYPYDFVVLELGIDGLNQMKEFSYLNIDTAIVTALSEEHMTDFSDIRSVVEEEMTIAEFSKQCYVNKNLVNKQILDTLPKVIHTYSVNFNGDGIEVLHDSKSIVKINMPSKSKALKYAHASAGLVGVLYGIDKKNIQETLNGISFANGRMNELVGKNGATIIDDSYNANPDATKLALESLYSHPKPNRIALLGNMNELGKFSEKLHKDIGNLCDPNRLDLVVTLGEDANKYLASVAQKNGCKVARTSSPVKAGKMIEKELTQNTVVLVKGSQNGVFAEEAIKVLLKRTSDSVNLVRQSHSWMSIKKKQFKDID